LMVGAGPSTPPAPVTLELRDIETPRHRNSVTSEGIWRQ
jgi:hypothetical protein